MKNVFPWTFTLVCSLFLSACAGSRSREVALPDWVPAATVQASASCPPPVGLFAADGDSSDPENFLPQLQQLLFDDHLRGFPVDAVRISEVVGADTLRLAGVLEGVELAQSERRISAAEECPRRWRLETDSGGVDATLRTEAMLWTAGVILPLSENFDVSLQLADDGALLADVVVEAWILGALMIPVRITRQYWLRYPAVEVAGEE